MTFRDEVRMKLGLAPVESLDPRALREAVRRSDANFRFPGKRLEIHPVLGIVRVACPDPYSTSGAYRLRRVFP